jgi:hypothetical protein
LTLPEILRWVAELPAPFRAAPTEFSDGSVRVRAVIADLFETLFGARPARALLDAFDAVDLGAGERNRLAWTLAAAHLLWHPALRPLPPKVRPAIERLLVQELPQLAAIVSVGELDRDDERREELARRGLRAAGVALDGESTNDAEDRLRQVDSVERHRVLVEAAERERRAREVREAMAKKAAEEAVPKVGRE